MLIKYQNKCEFLCFQHVNFWRKKMKMIEVSYSELKAKFNKLADSNKKITKLHQLFSNYFINTVKILNVFSLILNSLIKSDSVTTFICVSFLT